MTKLLAERSKSRMDGWLDQQVEPAAQMNYRSVSTLAGGSNATMPPMIRDSSVQKMLTGLYKSNNVNLHDFRRPVGRLSQINVLEDDN